MSKPYPVSIILRALNERIKSTPSTRLQQNTSNLKRFMCFIQMQELTFNMANTFLIFIFKINIAYMRVYAYLAL